MKIKNIIYKVEDLIEFHKSLNVQQEKWKNGSTENSLIDEQGIGIYAYDLCSQKISEVNSIAKSAFNCGIYQLEEGGLNALYGNVHSDDLPKIIFLNARFLEIVLESSEENRLNIHLHHPIKIKQHDGKYRWFQCTTKISRLDKNLKPAITVTTLVDITDVKKDNSIIGRVEHPKLGSIFLNTFLLLNGGISPISGREIDILKKLAKGMTSKRIAEEFEISPETVNRHRKKILKKLKTSNMIDAICIAKDKGLI